MTLLYTETKLLARSEWDAEAAFNSSTAHCCDGSGAIPTSRFVSLRIFLVKMAYSICSTHTEKTESLNLFFCFR